MSFEEKGWVPLETGEGPLAEASDKEVDIVAKGIAPKDQQWKTAASGEGPLADASEAELQSAVEMLEHGKRHVEATKGVLAKADEGELDAAIEALGGNEENPLEKLVAKTEEKNAKRVSDHPDARPQDQA
ncbi:MAG: hypothetical protein WCT10_03945 [Patescibacteria group bacterium]|jgi:hypothetical protein